MFLIMHLLEIVITALFSRVFIWLITALGLEQQDVKILVHK